jgi:O-antigen/teichoic acid export membrane protein
MRIPILSRLSSNRAFRGTFVITVATSGGQLLFLAASPFLTRLYGPQAFGTFAVVAGLISVLAVVATLRLEWAIPVARDDRSSRAAATAALTSVACISIAAALCLVLLGPDFLDGLTGPELHGLAWFVIPLGAFAAGVYEIASQYLVRRRAYGALARRSVGQSAISTGAQLGFGFAAISSGMLLGQIAGKIAATALLLASPRFRPVLLSFRSWPQESLSSVKTNWRFAAYVMPSSLLNTLGLQLPYLIAGPLYGIGVAGALGLTQRVLAAPAALIGQAIANVFMGETAARIRAGGKDGLVFFRRASLLLLLAGAPVFGVVAWAAPAVFPFVFGPDWHLAGVIAQALSLTFYAQFVVAPLSQALIIAGAQRTQFIWDACRVALVAGSLLVPASLGFKVEAAVWVYSATSLLSYGLLWALAHDRLRRVAHNRSLTPPTT